MVEKKYLFIHSIECKNKTPHICFISDQLPLRIYTTQNNIQS